ncbi:acetyl-CoA acetyltransferase [Pseudonocardia petroleophila]|uniref:propanoyl-CoA C-acyltransferase n=1 Tax=Pseudonocardia petroleophila TaxID=37331 RepID=A0A7G7MLU4_9PSEU|nr:acetyl-CoA acetyltransferase [Pseudonocardia petroleophila]QNG53755.1 thiolase domain-containing protein [Pseudonocardia petroleophila]
MTVHVLGGAQTDFARVWSRESTEPIWAMLSAVVPAALADAGVDAADVEAGHVANLAGELFAGQAHLGAMLPALDPAWSDLPTSRHEAACASGGVALLAAAAEIEAGRYDAVLVVGVEQMRSVAGTEAARHLGSAAWVGRDEIRDGLPWPSLFEAIAQEVDDRYGLDRDHLTALAVAARERATHNPSAQTRSWHRSDADFAADDQTNPLVTGRMRQSDCGRITDGAAAVVLAGDAFTERWRRRHRAPAPPHLAGWGHRTATLSLADKLAASRGGPYLFPHLRRAVTEAYDRAGIGGPADLDVIETHDCFTITEYVALDHLGITPPGRNHEAVEDGRIFAGGAVPVNPSGGLLAAGHPVGATGVRMLLDLARQLTGRAEGYQVEGARRGAMLNIGGSAATVVTAVLAR